MHFMNNASASKCEIYAMFLSACETKKEIRFFFFLIFKR